MSTLYDIGYNDAMKEMLESFTSDSYQNQVKASFLKEILGSDKFNRFLEHDGSFNDYISRENLEKWLEEVGGVK